MTLQVTRDSIVPAVTALSDSLRAAITSLPADIADSLRTILGSVSVHVADTLRVISVPEGWSVANSLALAALVVSAIFSILLVRLQRQQNTMVDRHEQERRGLEEQIRAQQTQGMDQRIGWTAFKLARQLETWVTEPIPDSDGRLPHDVVAEARGVTSPAPGQFHLLARWATTRCAPNELTPAENRAEVLVDSAAAASSSASTKAVEAFRIFHEAVGYLNTGLTHLREGDVVVAGRSFVSGYDVLRVCIERLRELIPEDLQAQLVFLSAIPSTLRTYAPTVSVEPAKPEDAGSSG